MPGVLRPGHERFRTDEALSPQAQAGEGIPSPSGCRLLYPPVLAETIRPPRMPISARRPRRLPDTTPVLPPACLHHRREGHHLAVSVEVCYHTLEAKQNGPYRGERKGLKDRLKALRGHLNNEP